MALRVYEGSGLETRCSSKYSAAISAPFAHTPPPRYTLQAPFIQEDRLDQELIVYGIDHSNQEPPVRLGVEKCLKWAFYTSPEKGSGHALGVRPMRRRRRWVRQLSCYFPLFSRDGIPSMMLEMEISSSMFGQWMPSPSPIIVQLALSAGFA